MVLGEPDLREQSSESSILPCSGGAPARLCKSPLVSQGLPAHRWELGFSWPPALFSSWVQAVLFLAEPSHGCWFVPDSAPTV